MRVNKKALRNCTTAAWGLGWEVWCAEKNTENQYSKIITKINIINIYYFYNKI